MLIHRHVHDVRLARAEHAERTHVRGGLGEDDVARVHEEFGDEVECLLAARRYHDVVRVGTDDTVVAHDLRDVLAQDFPALAVAVLHGLRAVVADQLFCGRRELIEGEILQVRHAAREGNDLGAGDDREEGADLGCAQVQGLVRVDVVPGVEAVALRARRAGRGRGRSVC